MTISIGCRQCTVFFFLFNRKTLYVLALAHKIAGCLHVCLCVCVAMPRAQNHKLTLIPVSQKKKKKRRRRRQQRKPKLQNAKKKREPKRERTFLGPGF